MTHSLNFLIGLQMVSDTVMVFVGVSLCANVWFGICNYRTHTDVMKVLEAVRHRPVTGMPIVEALQKVEYMKHLHAYAWFRDPWKLYDPIVKGAIDHPITEVVAHGIVTGHYAGDGPPPRAN